MLPDLLKYFPDEADRVRVQHNLWHAYEIQSELRKWGIRSVICGGAVRDILHGRVPKDVDIVILGDHDPERVRLAAERAFERAETPPASHAASEVGDPVLCLVVQADGVDVIMQSTAPHTPEDVVESFDCTLNMCWIDPDSGMLLKHDEYPAPFGRVRMLSTCRDPLKRAEYLRGKCPGYVWMTYDLRVIDAAAEAA